LEQTNQIDLQNKKKAQAKKITAFQVSLFLFENVYIVVFFFASTYHWVCFYQFSPINPSEVLVTSADSRIRVLDGTELVQKFRGM